MGRRIDISLPCSWTELTQEQLLFLLETIYKVQQTTPAHKFYTQDDYSSHTGGKVAALCLLKWGGLEPLQSVDDGWLVTQGGCPFWLSPQQISAAIAKLEWVNSLPTEPVRLESVCGHKAAAADLSADFSFDDWLTCDSVWQAYQHNADSELLRSMAEALYHAEGINPSPAELLGVWYWWATVKAMVSAMFPHFLRPAEQAPDSDPPSYDDLRRGMDAQIRALTKGDVTKESVVLGLNAIRALTELDAQAREYEELNRRFPTHGK